MIQSNCSEQLRFRFVKGESGLAEKTCLGIDIGNSRAKIAVKKGGIVRRLLSETVPDGLMKENHIVSYDAMGDFLREMLKKNRISIKNAHLCMPIHELYLRYVTLPMMSIQQLKVNLPYEFHDYITEDMGNYVYDYAVLPDRAQDGQLHLIACAASKTLIASHQQMAKRAHIKLVSIEPANAALFRFLESRIKATPEGETPNDYAILDLGDTSVKIHFFTRGTYEVTRSMDFGVLAASQRISEEEGQDIHIARQNLETNAVDIQSAPYLEDVFSDLASRIMRVMNFYNFNNRNNTLEDLYYFGGGSLMEPLLADIREAVPLNIKSISELIDAKHKLTEEELLIGAQAVAMTM